MPTSTTNFGLEKPLVNSATDQDIWGNELNADMDDIDGLLLTAMNWQVVSETTSFVVTAPTTGTTTTGSNKLFYLCDATAGAIIATLPSASSAGDGFTVAFKKVDATANTITLQPTGSDAIDGAINYLLSTQYTDVVLVSQTSTWYILGTLASLSGYAPIASPAFTGTPTAPTATTNTNNTQLATTAYVDKLITLAGYMNMTWSSAVINSAKNVSSVVVNGAGDYTINFTTAFPDTNYGYMVSTDAFGNYSLAFREVTKLTTSIRLLFFNQAGQPSVGASSLNMLFFGS
jgi:hypothetical protein